MVILVEAGLLVTAVPADPEVLAVQVAAEAVAEDTEQAAEADHFATAEAQVAATVVMEVTTAAGMVVV